MAISVPNVTKIEAGTGSSASNTVTWTSGNALIAPAVAAGGASTPVMSGGGGAWTVDTSGDGNGYGGSISSNPNPTGTSATITVTDSTDNSGVTAFVYEVAGLPSSGIKDASSPAVKTAASGNASTNTLSNVTPNAIFFGVMGLNSGSSGLAITGTASGWTYPAGGVENNGSSFDGGGSGYDIVSSVTSNNSSTWTNATNTGWVGLIAVYKGASAVAASGGWSPAYQYQSLARHIEHRAQLLAAFPGLESANAGQIFGDGAASFSFAVTGGGAWQSTVGGWPNPLYYSQATKLYLHNLALLQTFGPAASIAGEIRGDGAASFAFTPVTATGAALIAGAGSASFAFTPVSGGGAALIAGAGSASFAFTVTGTGAALIAGAGSASFAFTTTATGAALIAGDGSASFAFTVTGTGSALIAGDGASSFAFTATGTGAGLIASSGSAAFGLTVAGGGSSTGGSGTGGDGAAAFGFAVSGGGAGPQFRGQTGWISGARPMPMSSLDALMRRTVTGKQGKPVKVPAVPIALAVAMVLWDE